MSAAMGYKFNHGSLSSTDKAMRGCNSYVCPLVVCNHRSPSIPDNEVRGPPIKLQCDLTLYVAIIRENLTINSKSTY